MPGASPLADDLDTVQAARGRRRGRDRHALAVRGADHRASSDGLVVHMDAHAESFAEALSYFPRPERVRLGPDEYLEQIRKIKATVKVPVIASLNGTTDGRLAVATPS